MPALWRINVFLLSLLYIFRCEGAKEKQLFIGGDFSQSSEKGGWAGGQVCLPVAQMALEDVNGMSSILPDYQLVLNPKDSQCDVGVGARRLYEWLYKEQPGKYYIALLTGCSLVTTSLAEVAHLWNLIVIAYGASSPALADRERFPTLFRTHPSATLMNPTRVAILKKYGWKNIAIVTSKEEIFVQSANELEELCNENDIKVTVRETLPDDPSNSVRVLKRKEARVIVGLFYEQFARQFFCQVFHEKLYGPKYVYILIGWYPNTWFDTTRVEDVNCTREEMLAALNGHITTEAQMFGSGVSDANMTSKGFKARLNKLLLENHQKKYAGQGVMPPLIPENLEGYAESPVAYDAVWTLAMALDCASRELKKHTGGRVLLEHFWYENSAKEELPRPESVLIKDTIFDCVLQTDFLGISGRVKFDYQGTRIMPAMIEQLQDGEYVLLGGHNAKQENTSLKLDKEAKFVDGKVPVDSIRTEWQLRHVGKGLFAGLTFILVLLALLAVLSILVNIRFSARRYMHLSQPLANSAVSFGCLVCCSGAILMGVDSRFVAAEKYHYLCQARAWVLTMGFSLAFGSMFGKIWCASRMGTKELRDKPIPLWRPLQAVGIMLIVDICYLLIWSFSDKMTKVTDVMHQDARLYLKDDKRIVPYRHYCFCAHFTIWIGVLFAYKGLLCLLGVFMAYSVRSVKVKHMNDTRMIGMSIYNVVVLSVITGPILLIISNKPDASFSFITLTVTLCGFFTLGVLYVPKLIFLYKNPGVVEERGRANSNFIKDEDEERYRKICAENEEIKQEIAEKELRIRELRRRLEQVLAAKKGSGPEEDPGARGVTFREDVSVEQHPAPNEDVIL